MIVPLTSPNAELHRRQLAAAVNAATRGELDNTGKFTVPAGSGAFTLEDARLGVGKVLLLSPANAAAAMLRWYAPEVMNGQAALSFLEAPAQDAIFYYAVMGGGNTRGVN